ncbi:MAG: calcium-binding protein, partial [Geminicoccaceae bacterium]
VLPAGVSSASATGSLLDTSGLTHIGSGGFVAVTESDPVAAADGGHGPLAVAAAPASTAVTFDGGAAAPMLDWPSYGETTAAAPDEDVGPIGRYVRGDGSDQTVVLTDADDIFVGSDADEHVLGLGGDDRLDGAGGDDWLEGGAGQDTLLGGSGDDLVDGGSGDDRLDGGIGDDRLLGGTGADLLDGGSGNDVLDGGAGTDLLAGGTGSDVLVLADVRDATTEMAAGANHGGNDTVVVSEAYARSLADVLPGTGGKATFVLGSPDLAGFPHDVAGFRQQIDPDIESIRLDGTTAHDVVGDDRGSFITGNAGANHLYGGGGVDHIEGGAGGDWIHGGTGDDWIDGGDGNDWLEGGDGTDTLYGGAGDDTFVLGLHEGGGDQVFDHQGHNTLSLAGADPGRLVAEMQGNDLVLTHADRVVATVHDYADYADSFTGIDLGHGVRAIEDFMAPAPAAATAQSADWLAEYLPTASTATETALAEPWSTMTDAPDVDGGSAGDDAGAGAVVDAGGGEHEFAAGAMLAISSPMTGDDLWLPVDPEPSPGLDAAGLDHSPPDADDTHTDKQHPATG